MSHKEKTVRTVLCITLAILILLTMTVIFLFSSESREESGDRSHGVTRMVVRLLVWDYDELSADEQAALLETYHLPIRKLGHLSEYALLAFLCGGFMHALGKGSYSVYWLIPAAFCLLYAISDEVHQIFSSRGASAVDVCIDFIGAMLGLCVIHAVVGTAKRIIIRRKEGRA